MKLIADDVEAFHLSFADLDAFSIVARVERTLDLQTRFGRRGADQLDHGKMVGEGPTAPAVHDNH
jgi:hypothetical protein